MCVKPRWCDPDAVEGQREGWLGLTQGGVDEGNKKTEVKSCSAIKICIIFGRMEAEKMQRTEQTAC